MKGTELESREKSDKKRSNHIDYCAIRDIYGNVVDIKIRWRRRENTSLDAEFNALQKYVVVIEEVDLQMCEKFEKKRWNHTDDCAIHHIFPNFVLIKMHWKRIVNASLNAEFNGLQGSVIR